MKSTAERVLDVAEALFAEKGYKAASLGEVADGVGIRSPSLYNHFRNKEALYEAVLERLLDRFNPVSYTHLRAHETVLDLVCRLLLEKKKHQTLIASSPLLDRDNSHLSSY